MSSDSFILTPRASDSAGDPKRGIAYWMEEVLVQCEKAEKDFSSDSVHDLRTSLRRCRSLADGIRAFDPDSAWKKMRRAGKELFSSLGALRDTHVMSEWLEKLAPETDSVRQRLHALLLNQEQVLTRSAAVALQSFDRRQWKVWATRLGERANRIHPDSRVCAHSALERWHEAYALHHRALRNRTNVSLHDLRIGVKRFRYTVENFLPGLHQAWGTDLKQIQDALGEIHDLDVLWHTVLSRRMFLAPGEREEWRARLQEARQERLRLYRDRMLGKESLWTAWRSELPANNELRQLGLERLRIWASFLDPDTVHSKHVTRLALQLYDRISSSDMIRPSQRDQYREMLHAAALLHDVGHARASRGHHKASARMVRNLSVPLGWSHAELHLIALIARYHRGALPQHSQKFFSALSPLRQRIVQFLAGILRLACACDRDHDGKIRRLHADAAGPVLAIRAEGYVASTSLAEHLAAARHLLELACNRPILISRRQEKARVQAA